MPTPPARYDGFADWYDENLAPYAEAAGQDLLALLGSGPGRCLDLGCGTGATCDWCRTCRRGDCCDGDFEGQPADSLTVAVSKLVGAP